MRALVIAFFAAATLTACTTTEKTAAGAGVGGAVAGAVIGGGLTYLLETADGNCQYRNADGQVVTRPCHWR